jgi:hypothetical protein
MTANAPHAAHLWAVIHWTQAAMEHLRDDVAGLAAAVATTCPSVVLASADERWAAPPTARHLDHVCDHLVLAVRTLSEVEQRTTDPALREMCRAALDRITCAKDGGARSGIASLATNCAEHGASGHALRLTSLGGRSSVRHAVSEAVRPGPSVQRGAASID